MSFTERIGPAHQRELKTIDALERRGWVASLFGQAQIPEACRELLRRYEDASARPTLIRWMPDVLAARERPGLSPQLALIDAKGGDGPRHAIETRSVEAAEALIDHLYVPVFFVCTGGHVLTPRDVRERGHMGPVSANGSGTPYLLVEKRWARSFNDVFGPPIAAEQAA